MNAMKAINMCRAFYDIFVENTSDFFQFFTNKGVYQNSRQRNVCLSSDSPWQIDRLIEKSLHRLGNICVGILYTRRYILCLPSIQTMDRIKCHFSPNEIWSPWRISLSQWQLSHNGFWMYLEGFNTIYMIWHNC